MLEVTKYTLFSIKCKGARVLGCCMDKKAQS